MDEAAKGFDFDFMPLGSPSCRVGIRQAERLKGKDVDYEFRYDKSSYLSLLLSLINIVFFIYAIFMFSFGNFGPTLLIGFFLTAIVIPISSLVGLVFGIYSLKIRKYLKSEQSKKVPVAGIAIHLAFLLVMFVIIIGSVLVLVFLLINAILNGSITS